MFSLNPALEWKKSCNGPPLGSFSRGKYDLFSFCQNDQRAKTIIFCKLDYFWVALWTKKNSLFKIVILRREKMFIPERCSKVVKFAKNERLGVLMILARDERIIFAPWKWSKGGPLDDFFHFLARWTTAILLIFYLLITSFPLIKILVFVDTDSFCPRSCIMSANLIFRAFPAYFCCCLCFFHYWWCWNDDVVFIFSLSCLLTL